MFSETNKLVLTILGFGILSIIQTFFIVKMTFYNVFSIIMSWFALALCLFFFLVYFAIFIDEEVQMRNKQNG